MSDILALWLDATQETAYNDGDNVPLPTDFSGNSFPLSGGAIYRAAVDGTPALEWNHAPPTYNQYYDAGASAITTGYVIAVAKYNGATFADVNGLVCLGTDYMLAGASGTAHLADSSAFDLYVDGVPSDPTVAATNQWFVFEAVAKTVPVGPTSIFIGGFQPYLGAVAPDWYPGYIKEVKVFSNIPDAAARNAYRHAMYVKYHMLPVADFTGSPLTGDMPLKEQFTDASLRTTSWDWDFGDGSPHSAEQNPRHTYYAPGTYSVTLTATNALGNDAKTRSGYVVALPPVWPMLAILRQRVRTALNEATSGRWSDAEIDRLLNDGQRDIAAKALCLQEVRTLSSARYASDYRKILCGGHRVLYLEYVPGDGPPLGLIKIIPKMMGRMPHKSGAPRYWLPWGRYVILDPAPTEVYNYNAYVAVPPTCELYDDTDVPEIPADFLEDLIDFAVYRALWKKKKWGQSGLIYGRYMGSIQQKMASYVVHPQDKTDTITWPDEIQYKEAMA